MFSASNKIECMIFFYAIAFIVVVFLVWLLIVPVTLVCNTDQDIYEIRQPGTFLLKAILDDEIRFIGFIFGIRVKSQKVAKTEPGLHQGKNKRFPRRSFDQWMRLVAKICGAFQARRLRINLDTGDPLTTALLIPVGLWASRGPVTISGNFEGRLSADIELSVSLYKITWAFLKFLISTKLNMYGSKF